MNIDLGSISIGWREAVVGLIVLVALYIVVVLWRMRRLRAKPADGSLGAAPAVEPAEPVEPGVRQEAGIADLGWDVAQLHVAQDTFMRGVEDELMQLRDEVDALRGEVAALRDEMRQQVGQMRSTTQPVSPIYTDAMQMAQLGHDASTIAERCGIARAEAELMVALVKSQNR